MKYWEFRPTDSPEDPSFKMGCFSKVSIHNQQSVLFDVLCDSGIADPRAFFIIETQRNSGIFQPRFQDLWISPPSRFAELRPLNSSLAKYHLIAVSVSCNHYCFNVQFFKGPCWWYQQVTIPILSKCVVFQRSHSRFFFTKHGFKMSSVPVFPNSLQSSA